MRAGTESVANDQAYLDELFDRIVELIEDGHSLAELELEPDKEHLRPQVDRLVRLAQSVALGPTTALPSIPGYSILGELGRGGMGIVYLAREEKLSGRLVAIKVLLHGAWASGKQRRRFEREVDLVAALRHPNIVRLYNSGLTKDRYPFYVMEYIDGVGLDEWIAGPAEVPNDGLGQAEVTEGPGVACTTAASPPMTVRAVIDLVAKISEAVGYAHQRGTIHRDLKPSNIRIDSAGEPYVLDFGLAKMVPSANGSEGSARMSQTGEFVGSLAWASPEQADGAPEGIDVRTDVYSLGVVMFQLLTGRYPYPVTESFRATLDNIQHAEPARPSSLRSDVDDEVDTIVLRCLAKEPDRRYQTAGELARDLRHYLAGNPIEAKRDSVAYLLRKQLWRYRVALWVAALLVTVASIATVVSVSFERHATAERVEAQRQEELAQAINEFMLETLASPDPYAPKFVVDALRDVTVVEALDNASEKVETAFIDRPLIEAGVRDTLGVTYLHLNLLNSADTHLTRALELRREFLGEDHADTLTSLGNLAELREDQGELEEAEALWRQTWESWRQLLGDDHPDTLTAKDHTGVMLLHLTRYDEAEPVIRECLADRRRVLGREHPDTLRTHNNLGVLLSRYGRYAEAEVLIREVYDCYERDLGAEHFYTATVLINVANMRLLRGDYDTATQLFRSAHDRLRRCAGEEHANTLITKCMLSRSLIYQGRLDEAESLIMEVLNGRRRVQGDQHWQTFVDRSIPAELRYAQGRLGAAEELLRRVITVQCDTLGEAHSRTLGAMTTLGKVMITLGRADEAVPVLRKALHHAGEIGRGQHPDTLLTMIQLARALRLQGQYSQSAELLDEVLSLSRATLDVDHPITLSARTERGLIDLATTDPASAAAVFEEVVAAHRARLGERHAETLTAMNLRARALCEAGDGLAATEVFVQVEAVAPMTLPPGHWLLGVFACDYGRCLLQSRDYASAEERLLNAHTQLSAALGPGHPGTRRVAEFLAELYETTGQADEAAAWRDLAAGNVPPGR